MGIEHVLRMMRHGGYIKFGVENRSCDGVEVRAFGLNDMDRMIDCVVWLMLEGRTDHVW